MRYLPVVLLLACVSVGAQNINEQPLFGEQPKSAATVDADRQFVETSAKTAGSREAAAQLEIDRAWKQLKQGDADVAIQGFNQAYLLNPKSAEVYWGLGVATTQQGKYDIAVRMFGRALALDPENPRLLADVGLAHARAAVGTSHDPVEQAKRLQGAMPWFDAAEKLAPKYPLTYANRAVALYLLGQYSEAWVNVEKAEVLDSASIDPKLIDDLSSKMPRPTMAATKPATESVEVKTEALATQPVVQQEALPDAQPEVRKEVMPQEPGTAAAARNAQQAPTAPAADTTAVTPTVTVAPVTDVTPTAKAAEAKVEPVVQADAAPAVPATGPEAVQKETPKARKKKLRVVSGQPAKVTGADKRACLDLPTNEAIMRCVYPRK